MWDPFTALPSQLPTAKHPWKEEPERGIWREKGVLPTLAF